MNKLNLIFGLLLVSFLSNAQNIKMTLADPQPDLTDVWGGDFASGDVDGDGDIDLIVAGITPAKRTILYLNDGNGVFTESNIELPQSSNPVTILEDLDNDGDLDLYLSGNANTIQDFAYTYLNDGNGNFTQLVNAELPQIAGANAALEDVDNDGDLDVLITGEEMSNTLLTNIYLNDGDANFTASSNTTFVPVRLSTIAFIDIENDGDADVIIAGEQSNDEFITTLYINDGDGNFTPDDSIDLPEFSIGDLDAADTDNDGDSDVLISGILESGEVQTIIYMNNGSGQFTELADTNLQNTFAGANEVADFDNDGDQDILIIGSQDGGLPNIYNILYQNNGNNEFTPVDTLGGEYIPACEVADFDGDGLSDIVIQGFVDRTNFYWNTSDITSLEELPVAHALTIYPNPSTGQFAIIFDNIAAEAMLKIYTTEGRLVREQSNISAMNHEVQLDLPTGTYFIQLISEHAVYTEVLLISQ